MIGILIGSLAAAGLAAWVLWPAGAKAAPVSGAAASARKPNPQPPEATPGPATAKIVGDLGTTAPLLPIPGLSPESPTTTPVPGLFYQVHTGDNGWRIARAAYGLANDGSGSIMRAWELIRKSPKNAVLSPSGSTWDGQLVPRHDGHAPRGSGFRLPVIWIREGLI